MSQKNVAELVTRKSDGSVWEVLYLTRDEWYRRHGAIQVRMGPHGQPRWKRTWIPIDKAFTDFEARAEGRQEKEAKP